MPDLQEVYRQRADDCRRQAKKANNREEEALWLAIAEEWLKLADNIWRIRVSVSPDDE